jgi:hypothetical protein
MSLPNGVGLFPGEAEKINAALEALAKDAHAPSEMFVKVSLHLNLEYPKHVSIGDGVKIVNSREEEDALRIPAKKEK